MSETLGISLPDTPRGEHLAQLMRRAAFAPKGKRVVRQAELNRTVTEELRLAGVPQKTQLPLPIEGAKAQ